MAVIPLESFPVGYRFHPTDVELVNHYLKRKINGRIRSDIEVIPEIDVCKCEPWDLPDKALIRSDDPEWFFFSPKDRKYPNGHRLNRATEAGYWKATGKDRTIRTKAPLMPVVIGMKKTLVFHRGRAPKGVRTNWIMHEYRATEPEFEYGEQGGYVLYRLFRKAEEKSPGCSGDEVGQQSLSPTPTKSSPCDPQHDTDAFEDFGTPIMAEPLNQVSPFSDILENPQSLLGKENPPSGITRWLADKDDRSSLKPPDEHCNDHVAVEQKAEAGAVMDPLGDALGQLCDPKYEHINSNSFPIITSPLRSYNSNPFLGSTDQGSHMGFDRVDDNNENNSMDEFWNSILSNQDEYSGGLNVQQMSTPEVIQSRSSSEVDTEAGIVLGDLGLHDPGWFGMDTPSALYENASLLPYDNNGPDVYSVDSGAESLQELFNSMRESNGNVNAFNNEVSLREEAGITGIKTRTAQPRHPTLDNLSTEQGLARRRIRLQVGSICRIQFDSGTKKEENEGQANIEVEDAKKCDIKLNDLPIHGNIVASLNMEEPLPSKTELKLRTRSTKVATKFDEVRGPILGLGTAKSGVLQARSTRGTTTLDEVRGPVLGRGTSKSGAAVRYVIWSIVLMTILVLLCVGIWKWRRPQSLWISGILDYFP